MWPACSRARRWRRVPSSALLEEPLQGFERYLPGSAKWRFANARPEPDVEYRSNTRAARSVENSIDTTTDQGRFELVYPHGPWLCHSSRSTMVLVMPT